MLFQPPLAVSVVPCRLHGPFALAHDRRYLYRSAVMRMLSLLFLLFLPAGAGPLFGQTEDKAPVLNRHVLAAVRSMPDGGGYQASQEAVDRLADGVTFQNGRIAQNLKTIGPSFCSGATYLVFLRVIAQLQKQGALELSPKDLARLSLLGVKDGEEIFGRWNANGPGVAKLFADLGCGANFTSWDHAQPGDFLKLWWTDAIGARERGHLVVYLGHTPTEVTFWSSNQPDGYGRKSVPRQKIKRALFSRLTDHRRLARVRKLPLTDPFLADMLRKDFTWARVTKSCRVGKTP